MAASMTVCRQYSVRLISIFEASKREKSRMSVIRVSSVSPEQRMVFTRSHWAGDMGVSALQKAHHCAKGTAGLTAGSGVASAVQADPQWKAASREISTYPDRIWSLSSRPLCHSQRAATA